MKSPRQTRKPFVDNYGPIISLTTNQYFGLAGWSTGIKHGCPLSAQLPLPPCPHVDYIPDHGISIRFWLLLYTESFSVITPWAPPTTRTIIMQFGSQFSASNMAECNFIIRATLIQRNDVNAQLFLSNSCFPFLHPKTFAHYFIIMMIILAYWIIFATTKLLQFSSINLGYANNHTWRLMILQ